MFVDLILAKHFSPTSLWRTIVFCHHSCEKLIRYPSFKEEFISCVFTNWTSSRNVSRYANFRWIFFEATLTWSISQFELVSLCYWVIIIYSYSKRVSWPRLRWSFRCQPHHEITPSQRVLNLYPSRLLGMRMLWGVRFTIIFAWEIMAMLEISLSACVHRAEWMQIRFTDMVDLGERPILLTNSGRGFANTCRILTPFGQDSVVRDSNIITTLHYMVRDAARPWSPMS